MWCYYIIRYRYINWKFSLSWIVNENLFYVIECYYYLYYLSCYIVLSWNMYRGEGGHLVNAFVDGIQVEIIVGNKEERKDVTVTSYWRLDCTNTTLITSSIARNASKKFELISNLKSKVRWCNWSDKKATIIIILRILRMTFQSYSMNK